MWSMDATPLMRWGSSRVGTCSPKVQRGPDAHPSGLAPGPLAADEAVAPVASPHEIVPRERGEQGIQRPGGPLCGAAVTPWDGSAGAPREDRTAVRDAVDDGGRARDVRVGQRRERGSGEHAGPVPAAGHLRRRDVGAVARESRVSAHLGQEPDLAVLGDQQVEVGGRPSPGEVPCSDSHGFNGHSRGGAFEPVAHVEQFLGDLEVHQRSTASRRTSSSRPGLRAP